MSNGDIQTSKIEELKRMPKKYQNEFRKVLDVQSYHKNEKRMVLFIWHYLKYVLNLQPKIDTIGNIIVTKGEGEYLPCIVAHMDTVHPVLNNFEIQIEEKDNRDIVTAYSNAKQVGCGGDKLVVSL